MPRAGSSSGLFIWVWGRSLSKWEEGEGRRKGPSPRALGSPEHAGVSPSPRTSGSVSSSLPGFLDDAEPAFRLGEVVQCVCQRGEGRSSKFTSCLSIMI